jgi:methionyl-tRNA formyltransferase
VINGEKVTGVTTMYMGEGLDTGDMILKEETEIGENETYGELHDRLCIIGAHCLSETMKLIEAGTAPREVQNAVFKLKMATQKGDYDKTVAAYENLKKLI